jgi:glycine/D-amino acid oxidase-like deaminating enzyme
MPPGHDVAIIGAGPNGLAAAAYLARAGAEVVVLEKRFERGGTLASDDYSTPFTYNVAQASLPLGPGSPVVTDLDLAGHGVGFIEPDTAVEVRAGDGELIVGRGGAGLGQRVQEMFASVGRACTPALFQPPVPEAALVAQWDADGEAEAAALAGLTPAALAALAPQRARQAGVAVRVRRDRVRGSRSAPRRGRGIRRRTMVLSHARRRWLEEPGQCPFPDGHEGGRTVPRIVRHRKGAAGGGRVPAARAGRARHRRFDRDLHAGSAEHFHRAPRS